MSKGTNTAAQRKYKYGLDRQAYQELLNQQRGKCAGCGEGETRLGRSGSVRSLSVDHCHTSGVIRGLLCDACNNILGRAKDNPAILRRLAAYVEVANPTRHRVQIVNADELLTELAGNLEGAF